MNGAEHYREAERLLVIVSKTNVIAEAAALSTEAQAHATLALAAATAYPAIKDWAGDEGDDARRWSAVTS